MSGNCKHLYHHYLEVRGCTKNTFASAHEDSGVARISPLLGHSMGTLRLYELPREVQKLIGGSGGILPPEFYSLPGRF